MRTKTWTKRVAAIVHEAAVGSLCASSKNSNGQPSCSLGSLGSVLRRVTAALPIPCMASHTPSSSSRRTAASAFWWCATNTAILSMARAVDEAPPAQCRVTLYKAFPRCQGPDGRSRRYSAFGFSRGAAPVKTEVGLRPRPQGLVLTGAARCRRWPGARRLETSGLRAPGAALAVRLPAVAPW